MSTSNEEILEKLIEIESRFDEKLNERNLVNMKRKVVWFVLKFALRQMLRNKRKGFSRLFR